MTTSLDWYNVWVEQHLALTVTLVRGANLTTADLFAAYDADPDTVTECTFDGADDIVDVHRVRVGQRNGWRFAIEHFTLVGTSDVVLNGLSKGGGEAYSLSHNVDLGTFQSSHDGRSTSRFDLSMPNIRYGAEPDRYLEQIERVGLSAGTTAGPVGGARLLELVTGFELDVDMLEAPLASAVLTRTI